MVVLTIKLKCNKSPIINEIQNAIITAVSKYGFYASLNHMIDDDNKIVPNGKKAKDIITVKDEYEAVKIIEKIKDKYVLVIYDCRFFNADEKIFEKEKEKIFVFAETLSELKPNKVTVIAITSTDPESDEELTKKITGIKGINFVITKRKSLTSAISDECKKIARNITYKKIKKLKSQLNIKDEKIINEPELDLSDLLENQYVNQIDHSNLDIDLSQIL